MTLLIAGLLVFVLIHLVPAAPTMRSGMVSRFGPGPYRGIFSVLSLLGLVLIVMGLRRAEFVPVYDPPAWGRTANYLLMLLAIYLFASNGVGSAPSSARYYSAHPLSWGIVVWSGGHLLANGDRAHVVLFGTFFVYGIISIISGTMRGHKPSATQRPALLAELAFIGVVLVAYVALFWGHRYFTGMPLV